MEHVQRALAPYRHLDPIGWVGVFRFLPVWAGLACAIIGTLMMLYGGRHLFRLVAGPLGALIATVWAGPLAVRLGFGANVKHIGLGATFALMVAGLIWPPVVVFFAFGVPAGLLCGQLAGPTDWLLGFGPGFFLGGALGVVMHRVVSAVLSAAAGAWVMVIGLMAMLNPFVPAVSWLAANPVAVLSAAGVLAFAGAGFQLFVRKPEEKRGGKRQEKTLPKTRTA